MLTRKCQPLPTEVRPLPKELLPKTVLDYVPTIVFEKSQHNQSHPHNRCHKTEECGAQQGNDRESCDRKHRTQQDAGKEQNNTQHSPAATHIWSVHGHLFQGGSDSAYPYHALGVWSDFFASYTHYLIPAF